MDKKIKFSEQPMKVKITPTVKELLNIKNNYRLVLIGEGTLLEKTIDKAKICFISNDF